MFTDEASESFHFQGFTKLQYLTDLDMIEFDNYYSDADSLKTSKVHETGQEFKIQSDLLRSNCRVTNQPDWGDIFIHMVGKNEPNYTSLAEYIVSHRKVSHFHEEINEMVFTHLMQAYEPDELMVSCLYTRRGGLDINPIRATSQEMIPRAFFSESVRLKKTLRQ
jgi:7-cyano-7-deazaguanine reductase